MNKSAILAASLMLGLSLAGADALAQNGNSARGKGDPVIANPGDRGNSPNERITLCHYTGNDNYVVITVSAGAADAHIQGHGDLEWDAMNMSCGSSNEEPEPPLPR